MVNTDHKITPFSEKARLCGRHHKSSTVARQVGGRERETSMQAGISEGQVWHFVCLAPKSRHFITLVHIKYMMLKCLNPNSLCERSALVDPGGVVSSAGCPEEILYPF